jgi:hypothetical protein
LAGGNARRLLFARRRRDVGDGYVDWLQVAEAQNAQRHAKAPHGAGGFMIRESATLLSRHAPLELFGPVLSDADQRADFVVTEAGSFESGRRSPNPPLDGEV